MKTKNLLILAGALFASVVHAQGFPNRPIKIIVAQPPGAGSDIIVRALSVEFQKLTGQPLVIENKPGGSETISADLVSRAPPDGYTVGVISSTFSLNQTPIGQKTTYDSKTDFSPVSLLATVPMIVAVRNELNVTDIGGLVKRSLEKPGTINYGSLGPTTFQGVSTEWLKRATGADLTAINYATNGLFQGMLANEVQVMLLGLGSGAPLLQSGNVKAIAVTTSSRLAAAPSIPAVAETYPGFHVLPWYGLVVPKNTPAEVIEKLNQTFNAAMLSPPLQKQLKDIGAEFQKMAPSEFGKWMADDVNAWKKIVDATTAKK